MKYTIEIGYTGERCCSAGRQFPVIMADSPQQAVNKIRRTLPENYVVRKVMVELEDWK